MAKTMTPSKKTTTRGQITKAVSNYRALLEKHAEDFDSEAVQTVLGQPEFAGEVFATFRKRVEAVSNMVVRRVKVNRSRSPQETIVATGRTQYTDRTVVDGMPRGDGEGAEVFFFKLSRYISDDDLEKEYDLRGLKPDPYAQSAVNETDPAFADDHPNGGHWKDSDGKWCYAAFGRWSGAERGVHVGRNDNDWFDSWWFAGVRK